MNKLTSTEASAVYDFGDLEIKVANILDNEGVKNYKDFKAKFSNYIFTEELQKQLVEQVELRKKLEREFQTLKGAIHF